MRDVFEEDCEMARLVVLWIATPAPLLAAFLLLPSEGSRTEEAPLRPPPGGEAPVA